MILEVYKPSIVLLQEVKLSTDQLQGFIRRLGYEGASNVDDFGVNKPGTAVVWHNSVQYHIKLYYIIMFCYRSCGFVPYALYFLV